MYHWLATPQATGALRHRRAVAAEEAAVHELREEGEEEALQEAEEEAHRSLRQGEGGPRNPQEAGPRNPEEESPCRSHLEEVRPCLEGFLEEGLNLFCSP